MWQSILAICENRSVIIFKYFSLEEKLIIEKKIINLPSDFKIENQKFYWSSRLFIGGNMSLYFRY
jgi:hypothetical protein